MCRSVLLLLAMVIVSCVATFDYGVGTNNDDNNGRFDVNGSKAMEVEPAKLKVTNMTFKGTVYSFVHQDHTWLEAARTCNKLGAVITDVTSVEEFQFIVQFCRKVRPPYTVWMGGVALGKGETYVWFKSGSPIPKDQLSMTPASDPNHGYCVRLNWGANRPQLSTWDCGETRWYTCKY